MDPEDCALRFNQREAKEFFLFKSVSLISCTFAQVRSRRILFCFKQTPERTTKQPLQEHKPPLARSLRDCRLAGDNERRLRPSEANSLTPEGDGGAITFSYDGCLFRLAFLCVSCFLCFSVFSFAIFPSRDERRGQFSIKDGSDWDAHQTRELLYQDRSAHRHLNLRQ